MILQRHAAKKWIKNDMLDVSIKLEEGTVSAHCHEFYELEIILDGGGTYAVDGKIYKMQRGACFFMSPISFHSLNYQRPTKLINIMFPIDTVNEELLLRICSNFSHFYALLSEKDTRFIVMLVEHLIDVLDEKVKQEHIVVASYLHCLLAKLVEISEKKVNECLPEAIERVLVWINGHFKERISVTDAASIANYSTHYFCEIFKKNMGKTFNAYLEELRFLHARNLLRYSNMSVTQICYECGFSGYSHFTTKFKHRYDITPLKYRKVELKG